jgi:hypothetical protein
MRTSAGTLSADCTGAVVVALPARLSLWNS